jgi:hypothetical protein
MTDVNPQAMLFNALAAAQAAAKAVDKDATNKFHRYAYTSAEGMIAEAKQALAAHGLAVVPVVASLREPKECERPSKDDGDVGKGAKAILAATWMVVHGMGGTLTIDCEWPVIPEKGRPFDKALAAARTASLNYLLRDLLQLPRVEEGTDLDHDSRDAHRQPPRQPPAPPPPDEMRERVIKLAKALRSAEISDMEYARREADRITDETPRGVAMRVGLREFILREELGKEWKPTNEDAAKYLGAINKYLAGE